MPHPSDLGRTREEYERLIHSLGGIVWEADAATWQFSFVSPQAEAILGFPVRQWLEEPNFWLRHTHPDDVDRRVALCREATATGGDHAFDYRMIAADGRVVWLRDTVTITPDASGRVNLRGFLVDITDLKRAEEATLRSHRLYQTLLENSHDNIVMVSADGRTLYQSPAVERQLGYTPAELVGRNTFDVVHPDDVVAARSRLHDALHGETFPAPLRIRCRHKHGGWRVLDITTSRFANESGEQFAVLNTRDVTEFVQATEARRESDQRLQLAFEVAAMGVAEYDFVTAQVAFSDSFTRLLGYAQPVPRTSFDWFLAHVHDDDRAAVQAAFDAATTGSLPAEEIAFRVIRSDGGLRWWASRVRMLDHALGHRTRAIALCADITERKQLEEQARQAQKLEAISQLAGGIAHDFNNLLTVITGYAETLLASFEVSDAHVTDVVEIRRAAERATMLTQQLLAFSRKQILRPAVVDANAIVSDMAAMIARLIGRNIELRVDVAPGPAAVLADRGQVEQVLMNLAVNARDAMPFGGTLEMQTEIVAISEGHAAQLYPMTPGRYARLSVRDTGVGMKPEIRARVFDPFFTTKGPGKGTGIGLSTVHGIVKQSGGFIFVESEPGRGSSFDVYLPLSNEPIEEVPDGVELGAPDRTATILLVEDYRRVRELARKVLTREGYRVLTAESGADALAQCRDYVGRIDLVVTDVVMSPMSGPELAERLEAVRPGLEILYMSGYTGDMLGAHGVRQEGVSFIEKPFTPAALTRKVREILAKNGARQAAER